MNYMFGENMFSEYSKQELEAMFKDIRKFEKEGLISNCFATEEDKIRKLFKWLDHFDAFGLAEKEFFDEIAKRYFSENEAEWVPIKNKAWKFECGHCHIYMTDTRTSFCPACGFKMRNPDEV